MVLMWFRKNEDKTLLGAGFGVSRATAYRYVAEGDRAGIQRGLQHSQALAVQAARRAAGSPRP